MKLKCFKYAYSKQFDNAFLQSLVLRLILYIAYSDLLWKKHLTNILLTGFRPKFRL